MLYPGPLASTIYVLLLTLAFVLCCWAYSSFLSVNRLCRR